MTRRRVAGAAALAAATVALFVVSRGKWSDPLIDSGREWIVPDALSRGQLLYRDVVYWFGPFTPYVHAAFFRVFGSGFSTLVLAGCVTSLAALAGLAFALCRVTDRASAALWTALAIPALVFMPNAGGSILGMGFRIWHAAAFALVAIGVASIEAPGVRRLGVAGALAALAGLCRLEWGLAALSAAALVLLRRPRSAGLWRSLAALGAGFAIVFAPVWAFFFARVGWEALVRDQPVFLLNIPEDTRGHVGLASLRAWKTGWWNALYSASVWLGAALAIAILALRGRDPKRDRLRVYALGAVLLAAVICAAMGAVPGPVLFSAAPLVCLAALAESGRRDAGSRARALTGFAWMGLLASHRRFFFIDDAPYVAPPLLFAFVCAAGLLFAAVEREPAPELRRRLAAAFRGALAVLVALAFVGRGLSYASEDRVPVPGTAGMLSARPQLAQALGKLAAAVRTATRTGESLVVFPEGELLNFLADRPNPIRHMLYLPGYLTDANEAGVISELDAARPAAIVIWLRPTGEYERGLFGRDYGKRVVEWIDARYAASPWEAGGGRQANPPFRLLLRRERSP